MNKKDMRKEMMDRLASLDPSDKKRKEETLKTKLLEYISQLNITSVGIVLSMPHEMDTDGIISQLKSQGIEIYTPVCNYDQKVMNFCEFSSFDAVVKDEKGLRVPKDAERVNNAPGLILVPGLIYSQTGYRIGYGGGYYDKFLANYTGLKVSLLFEEQLGEVIVEPHDIPVDILITPERTIDAAEKRNEDA